MGRDKEGADRIELIIEDTGEGIPREDWEHIFDRGFSTYTGGTGLGLHLARNVLTSLAGSIKVTSSTVGEGTVFQVIIPKWESF
jgi:signal transduction histidine kinase